MCAVTKKSTPKLYVLSYQQYTSHKRNVTHHSERFTTSEETPQLPNTAMKELCEVSDETSTDRFPHFQCLTLQCDTSILNHECESRALCDGS